MDADTIRTYAEIGTAVGTIALAFMTFATLREMYSGMKRDRLVKEMELLVSPLNSKIRKDLETGKLIVSTRLFRKGVSPHPDYDNYMAFWTSIKLNKHLGIDYLRDALDNYFDNKSNSTGDDSGNDGYKIAEEELLKKIDQRYSELQDEIKRIDAKHWWRFWN